MNDFPKLNRAGQIRRIRSEVIATYRECGVSVKACRILDHQHNTTFRVELQSGELNFVRASRIADRPETMILPEIEWIRALAEDGHPVARPQNWVDGIPVKTVSNPKVGEERILTRFEWSEGKALAKPTCDQWRAIGETMAKLHSKPHNPCKGVERRKLVVMSENDQLTEDGLRLAEEVLGKSDRLVLERVVAEYLCIREDLGTPQLIHGDIHADNVLFRGEYLTLTDFEDCGFAPPIYDFCPSIRTLRRARLHQEERALLAGYQSVRPLPNGFDENLPVLINMRVACIIFYLLKDVYDERSGSFFEKLCRKKMALLTAQA